MILPAERNEVADVPVKFHSVHTLSRVTFTTPE